jgi:protein-tyrosine phosphatase/arsenate reductase
VAAAYYGIPHVETYSGGTEETAFNERAVAASERLGFNIEKTTEGTNPVYQVYFADDVAPVTAFSKSMIVMLIQRLDFVL